MSSSRLCFAAVVVLLIAGALLGRPAHPHFWWDRIPDFYALFGFAASGLLVLLKGLGKRRLQRPGSYYDA